MPASGYVAHVFSAGEVPTTTVWNYLWGNDASFNTGAGFNDGIIGTRHLDSTLIPTGLILPYGGATQPTSNWLICDGTAVSRSTYAALFGVVGTAYGIGDGSTSFNLPDMRGKVSAGLKSGDPNFGAIGQSGGISSISLSHNHTTDAQGAHNHTGTVDNAQYQSGQAASIITQASSFTPPGHNHTFTTTGVGNHGHNVSTSLGTFSVIQPYPTHNFIIKT